MPTSIDELRRELAEAGVAIEHVNAVGDKVSTVHDVKCSKTLQKSCILNLWLGHHDRLLKVLLEVASLCVAPHPKAALQPYMDLAARAAVQLCADPLLDLGPHVEAWDRCDATSLEPGGLVALMQAHLAVARAFKGQLARLVAVLAARRCVPVADLGAWERCALERSFRKLLRARDLRCATMLPRDAGAAWTALEKVSRAEPLLAGVVRRMRAGDNQLHLAVATVALWDDLRAASRASAEPDPRFARQEDVLRALRDHMASAWTPPQARGLERSLSTLFPSGQTALPAALGALDAVWRAALSTGTAPAPPLEVQCVATVQVPACRGIPELSALPSEEQSLVWDRPSAARLLLNSAAKILLMPHVHASFVLTGDERRLVLVSTDENDVAWLSGPALRSCVERLRLHATSETPSLLHAILETCVRTPAREWQGRLWPLLSELARLGLGAALFDIDGFDPSRVALGHHAKGDTTNMPHAFLLRPGDVGSAAPRVVELQTPSHKLFDWTVRHDGLPGLSGAVEELLCDVPHGRRSLRAAAADLCRNARAICDVLLKDLVLSRLFDAPTAFRLAKRAYERAIALPGAVEAKIEARARLRREQREAEEADRKRRVARESERMVAEAERADARRRAKQRKEILGA